MKEVKHSMSLGNDPRRFASEEQVHAVAAAKEAVAELRFDGSAPTYEAILREMGRRSNGSPIPGEETLPSHEASIAARRLLRDRDRQPVGDCR